MNKAIELSCQHIIQSQLYYFKSLTQIYANFWYAQTLSDHYAGTDRSRDDEAGLGIKKPPGGFMDAAHPKR